MKSYIFRNILPNHVDRLQRQYQNRRQRSRMGRCGMYSSSSGQESVAGSCKDGSDDDSVNVEYFLAVDF